MPDPRDKNHQQLRQLLRGAEIVFAGAFANIYNRSRGQHSKKADKYEACQGIIKYNSIIGIMKGFRRTLVGLLGLIMRRCDHGFCGPSQVKCACG